MKLKRFDSVKKGKKKYTFQKPQQSKIKHVESGSNWEISAMDALKVSYLQ